MRRYMGEVITYHGSNNPVRKAHKNGGVRHTWQNTVHSLRKQHLPTENQEQGSARPCAGAFRLVLGPGRCPLVSAGGAASRGASPPGLPPLLLTQRVSMGAGGLFTTCVEYSDQITLRFPGRADTAGVEITLGGRWSIKCYMLDFFFLIHLDQICPSGGI